LRACSFFVGGLEAPAWCARGGWSWMSEWVGAM
jgi:hypothetical protein